MNKCFFVTDLHGHIDKYEKLFHQIRIEKPDVLFLGGDILPHIFKKFENYDDFLSDFLFPGFLQLKNDLRDQYPNIFLILGNDDARCEEQKFEEESENELFHYLNQKKHILNNCPVYGYSFVPPTPFQMKDWEKYDVSRYVDPGCVPPTEGFRTIETTEDIEYATIQQDLESLTNEDDLSRAVFLFHSPPYKTHLDRAALDGVMVDYVPMDVHVGSIAIKRFIENRQPLITLHGHIHESTRITGFWKHQIGRTTAFNAAHDGPELSVIKFEIEDPSSAERILY